MYLRIGSRLGVAALDICFSTVITAPARADDSDGYSGSRGPMNGQNPHARQEQWPNQHQEPRPRPDITVAGHRRLALRRMDMDGIPMRDPF